MVVPLGCTLAPVCRCPPRELAAAPTRSGRGFRGQHPVLTPRVWGGRHPQPWLISRGFGGSPLSCFAVFLSIFPGGSKVKTLPAMQETQGQSLGQEDPLEKEMATYSSSLAWKIPWATVLGVAKSQTQLSNFTFFSEYPFTGSWLGHSSSSLQVGTSLCPGSLLPPQPSFCRM